ncbi:hypothetical protein B0T19DRAFT_257036 [Cercophora scortea]|uniref:Uncharacterized protein n=1 Tax=Cercophora scortea TaxID=314031 RepID=A0AAE0IAE2_9PEZI|nr:hypothetical protein B0T19DRAFT_257036 [Cercophora scortea]
MYRHGFLPRQSLTPPPNCCGTSQVVCIGLAVLCCTAARPFNGGMNCSSLLLCLVTNVAAEKERINHSAAGVRCQIAAAHIAPAGWPSVLSNSRPTAANSNQPRRAQAFSRCTSSSSTPRIDRRRELVPICLPRVALEPPCPSLPEYADLRVIAGSMDTHMSRT